MPSDALPTFLQKFTPRKSSGTKSARNLARAKALIEQGKMQPAGLKALEIRGKSDA